MKKNKILYQWDAGQKLTDCKGVFVDFVISGDVYRCDVVNGECIVPDELLQHPGKQTAYECMADNTLQEFVFSVVPRPLPPDYVYTPTEKLTFEGLVQKVEDTVADIIRRADSGEFDGYTPVKGKDYFTESEKNELMQNVSSGAIGEFREVVDSATAGFNKNSSAKTNDYNANAATKMGEYDNNAAEKLKAYNDNHTEKVTAYDANAADKTAEFDAHAAELQTEVNNLKAEGTTLRAEAGKQERRIDALMKLNKGQTYDILPEEGEATSRTAPSGAKYVSVDKVGGKSIVWNQQVDTSTALLTTRAGVTLSRKENGKLFLSGTATGGTAWCIAGSANFVIGHKYISKRAAENVPVRIDNTETGGPAINFSGNLEVKTLTDPAGNIVYTPVREGEYVNSEIDPFIIDLTLMFGAGNEPTAEQFEAMFPEESYPYNPGEIISSRTETITAGAESITTGFPELRSAMAAHDYIDMDGGKVHRKIKAVRIDGNTPIYSVRTDQDNCCRVVFTPKSSPGILISEEPTIPTNIISDKLATITHNGYWSADAYTGIEAYPGYASISMRLQDRTDLDTKEKVSAWLKANPMTVYYEINPEEVTDVAIPEPLQEWLPVEPGGTVTFRNSDESKQLAVPNAVSWVRKLNEVT